MAFNQGQQRVSKDRFGNDQIIKSIKGAKLSKGKGGGYIDFSVSGIGVAYAEIGGKLHKFTISPAKDDKGKGVGGWLSITKMSSNVSRSF